MAKTTQAIIAKVLNVSRETVTKALQDHPSVSVKTKEIVQKIAKQLNYNPNLVARNLVSGKSSTIGVIIPKVINTCFAQILEEVYRIASLQNYSILPVISFENSSTEEKNLDLLLSHQVDGIIADISETNKNVAFYQKALKNQTPVVFFDRIPLVSDFSGVMVNDEQASYHAVRYALQKGYKKPAHFGTQQHISIGEKRRSGFLKAVNERGIETNPGWIIEINLEKDAGYRAAKQIFSEKAKPDFVFAANDLIAQGIYLALKELRLQIPEDVGIIGFGNLEISEILDPPLTTIHIPTADIVEEAIDL